MKFDDLIKRTIEISKRFPNQYTKQERLLDVMEEAGELAQAVLIVEGVKRTNDPEKQKTVDDVADALSDILFAMINLADDYDRDLVRDYEDMLDRLERRLDSGEFESRKE